MLRERRAPRASRAFAAHLAAASLVFGGVALVIAGAAMIGRWAFRLELASSSTQGALEASRRILELHETYWPIAAVALVALALSAHWLGRRITGPLVRFVDAFEQVAAGHVPAPVAVRANDYVARELAALNGMLDALRERAAQREATRAELLATLDELAERTRGDAASGELLATALDQAKRLADGVDRRG